MKKYLALIVAILASALFFSIASHSGHPPANFGEAHDQINQITASLNRNIDRFEDLKDRMMDLGQSNSNYDEQKNIWLSAMLSLSAISAICEYESDLLTLFMELKEKNRLHFYEIRKLSLETSIQQLAIMNRQIGINHTLITHDAKEQELVDIEIKLILSSIDLLKKSLVVINNLKS